LLDEFFNNSISLSNKMNSPPETINRNLDDIFGEAVAPKYIDEAEKIKKPNSVQKLETNTAQLLLELMKTVENGLGVSEFVYSRVPILWVVDEQGEIWFSLEEIYDSTSENYLFANSKNNKNHDNYLKLGHPALIDGRSGRIGGELIFDNFNNPRWTISNASGRYGLIKGRKEEHLTSVAKEFNRFKIKLSEQFLPTRAK